MRFAFIRRNETVFRITAMCRVLSVTRQGCHAWKKRSLSRRALENEALLAEIRASHQRSKRSCGSPRVCRQLRRQGRCVGGKRVARLTAQDGLRAKRSRVLKGTPPSPGRPARATANKKSY
jgi:transposase InsO family protein